MPDTETRMGPVMTYMKGEHGWDLLRLDQKQFAARIDARLRAAEACVEALRDVRGSSEGITTFTWNARANDIKYIADRALALYAAATEGK